MSKETLWSNYIADDATNVFAAAWTWKSTPADNDDVFVALIPRDEFVDYLTTGRASTKKGGAEKLRYRPTNSQKCDMLARYEPFKLCTFAELMAALDDVRAACPHIKPTKFNKGHALEWALCKRWGIEWSYDGDAPHSIAGDITLSDGTEVQVKFQGASL